MTRPTARRSMVLVALVLIPLAGCAQIIGGVIDGAANAAGNRIGQSMVYGNSTAPTPPPNGAPTRSSGGGLGAMYNPQFAYFYTQFLFTLAFGAGGYDVSTVPFKAGEYAVWTVENGGEKGGLIERAFLAADTKGQQWWRVRFTDPESGDATTLEGLFSPDLSRLVRLRGRFPGDAEGKEMPVDDQAYYLAPRRLSEESVKGATKGVVAITVPAGAFQARHVVFGGPEGTSEWWIADGVPGGLVKQAGRSQGDAEDARALVLQKFGKDAKTELASF